MMLSCYSSPSPFSLVLVCEVSTESAGSSEETNIFVISEKEGGTLPAKTPLVCSFYENVENPQGEKSGEVKAQNVEDKRKTKERKEPPEEEFRILGVSVEKPPGEDEVNVSVLSTNSFLIYFPEKGTYTIKILTQEREGIKVIRNYKTTLLDCSLPPNISLQPFAGESSEMKKIRILIQDMNFSCIKNDIFRVFVSSLPINSPTANNTTSSNFPFSSSLASDLRELDETSSWEIFSAGVPSFLIVDWSAEEEITPRGERFIHITVEGIPTSPEAIFSVCVENLRIFPRSVSCSKFTTAFASKDVYFSSYPLCVPYVELSCGGTELTLSFSLVVKKQGKGESNKQPEIPRIIGREKSMMCEVNARFMGEERCPAPEIFSASGWLSSPEIQEISISPILLSLVERGDIGAQDRIADGIREKSISGKRINIFRSEYPTKLTFFLPWFSSSGQVNFSLNIKVRYSVRVTGDRGRDIMTSFAFMTPIDSSKKKSKEEEESGEAEEKVPKEGEVSEEPGEREIWISHDVLLSGVFAYTSCFRPPVIDINFAGGGNPQGGGEPVQVLVKISDPDEEFPCEKKGNAPSEFQIIPDVIPRGGSWHASDFDFSGEVKSFYLSVSGSGFWRFIISAVDSDGIEGKTNLEFQTN